TSSGATTGKDLKVALITAAAGQNDNGYNQSAVKGLEAAKTEYGVQTKVVDKQEDIPAAISQMAEGGYKLIFTLEYNFDALIKGVGGSKPIAEQYPETTFVVFNDNPNLNTEGKSIHKNVISVMFDVHQASFVSGALSVLVNENSEKLFSKDTHSLTTGENGRKVGFLGGTNSNGITVFSYGYAEGINYMAKELGVNYTMYTDYNAGFTDSAAGATKANAYYSDGANIVCTVAGSVGDGVDSKAKELKKLAIEVDADKDANQSGYILTSILKNTEVPVKEIIKKYIDGKIGEISGTAVSYSLKSGATGITQLKEIEKMVTESGKATFAEIKTKLTEIEAKIASGDIKVTNAQAGEKFDKTKLTNLSMPNDK
ncbi:MAG: BMP family ABC transporter substrate-binding protein, partial [Clostridia bacterium]